MKTRAVVFIHGMFMTPLCWEEWARHFQEKGHQVHTPAWPAHDRPVEELRRAHPDPALAKLTLEDLVDHHERFVRSLPEAPLLVGHSLGGLLVQILLQRGVGAGGVAIDSAAPAGVVTLKWSFIRSNLPVLNPFAGDTPFFMSFEQFQYTFAHTLPLAEQRALYDKHVVPESRRVPRGTLGGVAKIDFKRARPPLLLIAGELDRIIPASLNETNYQKYQGSPSVTSFKEFEGRTHAILAQQHWQEVADHALHWATDNQL